MQNRSPSPRCPNLIHLLLLPMIMLMKALLCFGRCCCPQAALLAIYHKILEADSVHGAMQEPGKDLPVRALVAQSQAGSLIGK